MKRIFSEHILLAWFNKKEASAIAKMEERLKAESQARAKVEERLRAEIEARAATEQKVEAEAEKMLLTQHRRYGVLAERVEAQAKEAIAAAQAEAEEKIRSYTAALAQAEEKLAKAKENVNTEAIDRAKAAEESLKAESEERQRVEAQAKEAIAAVKAEAEEKVRSYAAALAQAEEKLAKAKENVNTETTDRAKAEEESLKAESEERQRVEVQTAKTTKDSEQIHRHIFHLRTIKRILAFSSAIIILSAIAFAVTIAVSAFNDPPVAEPGSAMTQEEKPVSITLMGSEPDGEQLTYNIVTGPSHGSLTGTAPSMTYTPMLNYNGPDSFTFSVNDGNADSDQVMISITVLAVNDAPIANPQSETTKVNKSVSAALTGSDVDGDPLMFIICIEPEHGILTFDSNFNTNGRLIYTPKPYFTGTDTFTFKANDGEVDSAPATVSINIAPNHLPVADSHSVTTMEDTPVEISLTGSDSDKDPLAYSTVTGPSHGSLNGTAPNLTYTPNTNFNGSDSFTFNINDGIADSALATVSITVSPVNDPPVANDDTTVTQEDTPAVAIDVQANDTDIDNDTLTVTAVSQGTNGSVIINPDGTLTYSPNADFSGTDTFTYTISDDNGQTDTAQVIVTVNMLNDAPVFSSEAVTTATADTLYTYDVNAEDPDAGDTLTYSLTTNPDDMTIHSVTGLIQWKPTEAQVGANEVVVKVVDSNSIPAIDTQSFTITVNPPPPKIAKLTVTDGYDQRNRKTLSAEGKTNIVQSSDNDRCQINRGSYMSYDFSDASIPADAEITSVVICIEHFEEKQFARGRLEWVIGTGWPTKPAVWASIKAPVHEEDFSEATDSWDITNIVDTREKINALQLQVKNNNIFNKKTSIDYIYVVVRWD